MTAPADVAGKDPRKTVYVHVGQLHVATEPADLTTILGSCVAVCIFDCVRRWGGMNHYALAEGTAEGVRALRYGGPAIRSLLARLRSLGSEARDLEAKVFGGASVLEAFSRSGQGRLGLQNAELALRLLADEHIRVVGQDVGGHQGRKLVFRTDDGSALVRTL